MSRDSSGNYTLPLPPVSPNTLIESTWANTTNDDMATAMTDSLSRSGLGGMLAPLKIADGVALNPAFTFTNEVNSGIYRAGSNDVRWSIGGLDIVRMYDDGLGSRSITVENDLLVNGVATLAATTLASLTVAGLTDLQGDATVGGTLGVTGALTCGEFTSLGTLDVAGKATFSNAAFISSASGIGVTAGYQGAKFTIKQSGAGLTNGLQLLSAGDDDYSGYLVATFAARKFAVGANGPGGDPALGGSLDFDDFGYGWSLFAGDGGTTKRKILSSTRSGTIEAPLGQIQGGGSGAAFDLRAGAVDSQTRILGSNSASTGARLTLFGPSFGGANGLEFHWQNSLKMSYVTAAQEFNFQSNDITTTGALTCGAFTSNGIDDNATQLRAIITDNAFEFRGPTNSLTFNEAGVSFFRDGASYIDNRAIGASTVFRTSNAADRDTQALAIQPNGNATFVGALTCGTLTTTGDITGASFTIGAGGAANLVNADNAGSTRIYGGTLGQGANILLAGGAAGDAGNLTFRANTTVTALYTHATTSWRFNGSDMTGTVHGVGISDGSGRFEVVNALPGTPDPNTVYFVV